MYPLGVTFYPDQWPKEIWEKEMLRISEAGFNVIRFGEMAWNWVEPKEGKFNFDDMELALNTAEKYGLKVVLGIGKKLVQGVVQEADDDRLTGHGPQDAFEVLNLEGKQAL